MAVPSRVDQLQVRALFLALIGVQCLHSVEESLTKLYDVFAPARYISGLLTSNLRVGFVGFNAVLIGVGLWCYLFRVRPVHPGAASWMWFWALLELGNGAGHLVLAVLQGGYFPGAGTAPFLLVLGGLLAYRLGRRPTHGSATP
jgi:hypothetical protein